MLFNILILFVLSLKFLTLANAGERLEDWLDQSKQKKLAFSDQWIKLGHYQTSIWSKYKSDVAGPSFFISQKGRYDPEAELEETLRAFFKKNQELEEGMHPLCRFPARLIWIKKQLLIPDSSFQNLNCKLYQTYLKRLSAESISLVFSSYFINSPASAFGHTFLRVNHKLPLDVLERNELLDHGIGYAAEMTINNPFIYPLFGLAGLFHGTFTNVPYYYKIREYNDFEARDLWSYDLHLTPDEVEMLVAHLWELGGTHFDYYFLTQNCSYHILTALEAAAPRLKLTEKLPFYVIPSSTLQVLLDEPHLVRKINYRPSVRMQFLYRVQLLSLSEKLNLNLLLKTQNLNLLSPELSLKNKVHILDTAIDYLDYHYPENALSADAPHAQVKQNFLIARSSIAYQSEPLHVPLPENEQPHMGHGSRRMSFENGIENNQLFLNFQMRFALHDLLDPARGYPVGAQIEFFQVKARYRLNLKDFEIDELGLFRLLSLNPLQEFQESLSWRAELSAKKILDLNCDRCLAGGFEAGPGVTFKLLDTPSLLSFLFLEGEMNVAPQFEASKLRLGVGPAVGVFFSPFTFLRYFSEAGFRYEALAAHPLVYRWTQELRWHVLPSLAINFRTGLYQTSREGGLALMYYF